MIIQKEIIVLLIKINDSDINFFNNICNYLDLYGSYSWQIISPFIFVPINVEELMHMKKITDFLLKENGDKISILLKKKTVTEDINDDSKHSGIICNLSEEKEKLYNMEDGSLLNLV